MFVEREEGLPLSGERIALADERSRGIDAGVLHGGENLVGRQRLQGFLRPGAHEGGISTLAISGQGIGGIVPGGNHDGERRMQMLAHPTASRGDMLAPGVDPSQTLLLAPGGVTRKFVPTEGIG